MDQGAGASGARRRVGPRAGVGLALALAAAAVAAALAWPRGDGEFRVALHGQLDGAAAERVGAMLDRAPRAVLLVIDAEGDDWPAATTLLDAIARAQARGVRVGGFVEGRALGWAALAALACDALYVHPGALLGRALPYRPDSDLDDVTKDRWRIQAQASFEAVAQRRGRNVDAARALVQNDMVLEGADIVSHQLAVATCGSADEAERRLGPAGAFGSR